MSELSPAAQAVLDAFLGDAEHTGLQLDDMRENVAAALRAAADNDPNDLTTIEFDEGWGAAMDFVRAIAAELEV